MTMCGFDLVDPAHPGKIFDDQILFGQRKRPKNKHWESGERGESMQSPLSPNPLWLTTLPTDPSYWETDEAAMQIKIVKWSLHLILTYFIRNILQFFTELYNNRIDGVVVNMARFQRVVRGSIPRQFIFCPHEQ